MAFPFLPAIGGLLSGAVGAIGNIFSGNQQAKSVRDTNSSNEALARENREFANAQAVRQMDFQERMSNTARQREVADLKKAGLNPMLALMSGASGPPGAMGSAQSARMQPPDMSYVGKAVGSLSGNALGMLKAVQEFEATDAQINATKAAGLLSAAGAEKAFAGAEAVRRGMPEVLARAQAARDVQAGEAAKGRAAVKSADLDSRMTEFDKALEVLIKTFGVGSSAASIYKALRGSKHETTIKHKRSN